MSKKNIFSQQTVNTIVASEFVSRKALHTKNLMYFCAKVQEEVMTESEPWEAADKAAEQLPNRERALYKDLLKEVEQYAPANEVAHANSVWAEVDEHGEWYGGDPDTEYFNRFDAARRERVENFRAAFVQLLPVFIQSALKKPLF